MLVCVVLPARSILIADDNRDWTDSLAAILRLEGYAVHTAYDGAEAVAAAATALPDVVVLDIGMPKLTGYDVARIFSRHPEATRPVLIAVTAWGREADQLRAEIAGFHYHFTKPVDPVAIVTLLASLQRRPAGMRRILVVDDGRAWTDSLVEELRSAGHSAEAAYDSEAARAAAARLFPEIVILDLRMPGLGGGEAARAFRRDAKAKRPMLIAVSALDEAADRDAALRAGFDHFLPKPVQLEQLQPLIDRAAEAG